MKNSQMINNKLDSLKANSGFTLIELLVVLAIVGILSSMVLSNLRLSQSQARDTLRLSDVQTITTGLKIYYEANKSYPKSLRELVPTQLSALPIDPKSSSSTPINYAYVALGPEKNCDGYHLGVTLENKNNDMLRKDADASPSKNICLNDTKDFNGRDNVGCLNTYGGSCYDVKEVGLKPATSTVSRIEKR